MLRTAMKPGRELSRDCAAVASLMPSELVGNENRPLTRAMQGRLPILAIKGVCHPC